MSNPENQKIQLSFIKGLINEKKINLPNALRLFVESETNTDNNIINTSHDYQSKNASNDSKKNICTQFQYEVDGR